MTRKSTIFRAAPGGRRKQIRYLTACAGCCCRHRCLLTCTQLRVSTLFLAWPCMCWLTCSADWQQQEVKTTKPWQGILDEKAASWSSVQHWEKRKRMPENSLSTPGWDTSIMAGSKRAIWTLNFEVKWTSGSHVLCTKEGTRKSWGLLWVSRWKIVGM